MPGIRLGRLAGVDILVHWSWFFIFFLLTWSLSEGLFLEEHPEWTAAAGWLAGAVTSLFFFASVLLHELSHSLMARRLGMTVKSITLFIFGGVSALEGEPQRPRQELLIAAVGPATSFLLAGLFALAGLALLGTAAATASFYLAFINAVLGAFNLMPGFPLDGGRLLRAAAWARKGNLLEATRIASLAGTGLAFLLMAGGVLAILFGAFLTGVWFIVIGWFLRSQAEASYRQLVARELLQGTPIATVMKRDFQPVRPEISLSSLLSDYFLTYHGRCYPVMADSELLGLVTLTDLKKFPRGQWAERSVSEVMTPRERLQVVLPSDDLAKAAELMAAQDLHQLPVVEDGRFLGFVTRSDIIAWVQIRGELGATAKGERSEKEASELK